MTYPNGKVAEYSYDSMNRLVSVKGVDGSTTKYTYNALGQRIATDGAKVDTSYEYDEMGNLISQTTSGAYDLALEYAYDLSGRMVRESRTENGTTLHSSYIYDALGQLTEFTRSDDISESYAYDAVGNMLTKTANGVKTKYAYNAANQLISDGTNKYSYDTNGNLVQKGNIRYTYNALNLQESWTDGTYTENYSYNADGFLSGITTSDGSSTSLTWDMLMGEAVVISANENGIETNYTYGIERISAISGKSKTEYIYDGRGSVAAELSYTKAWYTLGGALSKKDVVSKSYTPFGEQIGEATSGFGYNGEYYNAATGQIYLRARFYEPEMNRFSQKDIVRGSITVPSSINRYTYVQNDPVNFIDPSGESLKSAWSSVKNAVSSAVSTVKTAVSNLFGGGSKSNSKPSGTTSSTKSAATASSGVKTSTTSSGTSSKPSYGGYNYSSGSSGYYSSGPVQSTIGNVNPYNTVQATSQAKYEAKKALDFINSVAPNSPKALRARQDYEEILRNSSMATSTNNVNITQQVIRTSQSMVNFANSTAVSGDLGYYNASFNHLKKPSDGSPCVKTISADYYCGESQEERETVYILFSNTNKINPDDGTLLESDFTDAANYILQKSLYENKNVVMMAVNTKDQFEAAWNMIPDNTTETFMLFHSNGKSLIFEDGSDVEAYNVIGLNSSNKPVGDIRALPQKEIDSLHIYACNSGNLSLAHNDTNIAEAFSQLTSGKVIGVDGNIGYGTPIAIEDYNDYSPRLSLNQLAFHKISGLFTSPKGFVEYRNGEVYGELNGLPNTFEATANWVQIHFAG